MNYILKMITKYISYFLLAIIYFQYANINAQNTLKEKELEIVSVDNVKYFLYYPKNYKSNAEKQYGLLLFLHGSGDIPAEGEEFKAPKALTDGSEFPFLILVPEHLETRKFWDTKIVMQLLDTIIAQNRVDKNKIYLSGLSRGASAAWNLVVEYPDTFAALAVVSGMAPTPYANWINKEIPIWVFHGEKDESIPVSESDEIVNRLKNMGYNVKYTRYKGLGHKIWNKVYTNPELFIWFENQKKV